MMNISPIPCVLILALTMGMGCSAEAEGDVRALGEYSGVTNRSDSEVVLVENKADDDVDRGDVTIVCSAGISADVDTSVDGNGMLVVELAAEVASALGCKVQVVSEGVTEVISDGDGDIVCEDPVSDLRSIEVRGNGSVHVASLEADELDIRVSGTGSLTIDELTVDLLSIDLEGGGDATLAGDAVNANLNVTGNGDLRAQQLTVSDTLDAVMSGTGDAVITVLGTVNAEIHGDGSLEVYGGAEAGTVVEDGTGEVIFR